MAVKTKRSTGVSAARRPATRRRTSAPKAPATRRRRKTVKKGGFLSEAFNPAAATAGAKAAISGAVGGAAAGLLEKFLDDGSGATKKTAFWQIGGGFLAATVLKLPNMGAGMAAVGMNNLMKQSGFLADGSDYSNADFASVDLELLPTTLSDEFLQDEFLQDEFLQDNTWDNPGFSYMS